MSVREHTVTVTIRMENDEPHPMVQARVLHAVEREFQERAPGLSVVGFDRAKNDREKKELSEERDDWRRGYLELRSRTETCPTCRVPL
jgi:hypothetical protein